MTIQLSNDISISIPLPPDDLTESLIFLSVAQQPLLEKLGLEPTTKLPAWISARKVAKALFGSTKAIEQAEEKHGFYLWATGLAFGFRFRLNLNSDLNC